VSRSRGPSGFRCRSLIRQVRGWNLDGGNQAADARQNSSPGSFWTKLAWDSPIVQRWSQSQSDGNGETRPTPSTSRGSLAPMRCMTWSDTSTVRMVTLN
jgi:hypothetical protein